MVFILNKLYHQRRGIGASFGSYSSSSFVGLFFAAPKLVKKLQGRAHEACAQCAKQAEVSPMGTELRRRLWRKQAKRKSNEQRSLASGSAARRLLRIVGTRKSRKRACERCGTTMPNCGTEALSRFNRPRRRVRRGRGDFCVGKSHFPEQKSFPCSFRARKSAGF